MRATIGSLELELVCESHAVSPNAEPARTMTVGGTELDVYETDSEILLVIDHRRDRDSQDPARVELWRCGVQVESNAHWLLAFVDAAPTSASAEPLLAPATLWALVDTLSRPA